MPVKWTPENDQIVSPLYLPLISSLSALSAPSPREKSTPKTDQLISYQLLLKILETSDISPKPAEISEKWRKSPPPFHIAPLKPPYQTNHHPAAGMERPTPRAISERIFKIRAMAKVSGTTGHFSVSSAKSTPSTPRKNVTNGGIKKASAKKPTGLKATPSKRKRGDRMSEEYAHSSLSPGQKLLPSPKQSYLGPN